jgi:hypothetical protein
MSVINTGKTFANGEQLTADKLNQVIDQATFNASEAVDGSTITLISGAMAVNDNGITEAKIEDGAITKAKIENVTDMTVLGNTSGSDAAPQEVSILDEDDMNSNSDTELATQQSIKAYVDGATKLIQRQRVTDGTASSTTATMNFDNSAPLITEGTEILSTTFTPTSTSNEIIVDFDGLLFNSSAGNGCMLALFEGSTCVGARWWFQAVSGGPPIRASFSFTPSSTNQATYSLRFGVAGGTTGYINSVSPSIGYTLGGNMKINMEIQEVRASQ